jgi:hypothetical protein
LADKKSNEENDMRKAHKIFVNRFVQGNQGRYQELGFVFRHGEVEALRVPRHNGCTTPRETTERFLVVQVAGFRRYIPAVDEGTDLVVMLADGDRDPSGLYTPCSHCNGKGYAKVQTATVINHPDTTVLDELTDSALDRGIEAHRVLAMDEEKFARELEDMKFPGRGVSGSDRS